MKNDILFVTYDRYPNGNAGAVRQHVFAKSCMDIGYEINLIGMGMSTNFEYMEYEGVRYISLRHSNTNLFYKLLDKVFYKKRLKKLLAEQRPKAIMIVDLPLRCIRYIKKYASEKNIPIIHDSVEWYSKEEFKLGRFSKSYIHKNILNKYIINKEFRVIAISEYLRDYYLSKDIQTYRIPFVQDVQSIEYKKKLSKNKIIIVYAGMIGKKDYFGAIIQALNDLEADELSKLELRIIGTTKSDFIKNTGINEEQIKSLGKTIVFMGRVSRYEVLKNLEEANFTILMRPEHLRYAKAGFPTKVTESLSYATPVIANLTSDLDKYLIDGFNSVVVRGTEKSDVLLVLKKILMYQQDELEELCKNARKSAEEKLDYRHFLNEIKQVMGWYEK